MCHAPAPGTAGVLLARVTGMSRRIRLVQFTNTFHLGGGEVQFVELLRGLPRERYDLSVLALEASGAPAVAQYGGASHEK